MNRGILLKDEPLSEHTSLRVGGPAKNFYQPADLEDLIQFIKSSPHNEQLIWLGLGSNLLVRDDGVLGTVIATQGRLSELTLLDDVTLRAEAGVACAQLARFCARQGLSGGEFWAGIPGTVGGALAMNAGCAGSETWDFVCAVETIDKEGNKRLRYSSDFEPRYREVKMPEQEWFVAGHFRFHRGEKEEALAKIRALLDRRAATQPTGEPNCGSVFRNPPGDFAARLIEACGLKGFSIGGAQVSQKHANFIINTGTASASDVEALMEYIAEKVEKEHKIRLIREVHILGDK